MQIICMLSSWNTFDAILTQTSCTKTKSEATNLLRLNEKHFHELRPKFSYLWSSAAVERLFRCLWLLLCCCGLWATERFEDESWSKFRSLTADLLIGPLYPDVDSRPFDTCKGHYFLRIHHKTYFSSKFFFHISFEAEEFMKENRKWKRWMIEYKKKIAKG